MLYISKFIRLFKTQIIILGCIYVTIKVITYDIYLMAHFQVEVNEFNLVYQFPKFLTCFLGCEFFILDRYVYSLLFIYFRVTYVDLVCDPGTTDPMVVANGEIDTQQYVSIQYI